MSSLDDNMKVELSLNSIDIIKNSLNDEGKLPCIKAFKIAKKINKEPIQMSAITKSLGIKISDCELAVFGKLKFKEKDENVYNNLLNRFNSKVIKCKDLWDEAKNSSLKIVGSTVKNSDIEVNYCQLGCFREKKGLKKHQKVQNES